MKFEYDEHGITSYYFAASFYTIVLLPVTYFFWPRSTVEEDEQSHNCRCNGCRWKRHLIERDNPWKARKRYALMFVLVVAWVILVALMYKVSTIKVEVVEYDPYKVLNLEVGASESDIRRAYRQLSLQYHPDRGGDAKQFVTISKAYEALTDEATRRNWQEYGNPDGPTAMQFGIALPKWMVEKQNSVWVLAAYGLVFMVLLPVVVGTWWYRSIRMTVTQVLRDTTNTFYRFIICYPSADTQKLIKIMSTASEFARETNAEIVVRPSDAEDIPALLREFPDAQEEVKMRAQQQRQHIKTLFAYPPAQKAAVLIHAHLARHELPARTLLLDKEYVIRKLPLLINELLSAMFEIMMAARSPQPMIQPDREPKTRTIESLIKVEQMIVQAMWDNDSSVLQLPHLTQNMLKDIFRNRRTIRKPIFYLAALPESDRRNALRMLNDEAYQDVKKVLGQLPYVTVETTVEVRDEVDKDVITTGSVVTVTVTLNRCSIADHYWNKEQGEETAIQDDVNELGDEDAENEEKVIEGNKQQQSAARPNANKKKRGKAAKNKKNKQKLAAAKKKQKLAAGAVRLAENDDNDTSKRTDAISELKKREGDSEQSSDEADNKGENEAADGDGDANDDEDEVSEMVDNVRAQNATADDEGSDDEAWQAVAARSRKRELAASKTRSFAVHCPHFPTERQEGWWVFLIDRKFNRIELQPQRVAGLTDTKEVEFQVMAPSEPGFCTYNVCVRSDSYLDLDVNHQLRFEVVRGPEPEPRNKAIRKRRSKKADDSATATESEDEDDEKRKKRAASKRHDRAQEPDSGSEDSDSEMDSEESDQESTNRKKSAAANDYSEDSDSEYRDD